MLYLQSEYIQKISPPGRDKLKAIILAGGSGSRLWPLSNDETPKQLLAINSEYTLLQNTFRRLLKLTDAKNILTVTNHKFHEKTRCQLSQLASDSCILSEPCAKNTAPAICCALEYCLKSGGDDVAVIVPADHLIKETDKFCQSIIEAAQAVEKGYIATFPILLNVSGEPTYFMALKDSSQLVKMYAMVNVEQSTIVGVGASLAECTENYAAELKSNGVNVEVDVDSMGDETTPDAPQEETVEITGAVAEIRSVITGGETYFYIRLADGNTFYKVAVKNAEKIVILNVGDAITFVIDKAATGDIITVKNVK